MTALEQRLSASLDAIRSGARIVTRLELPTSPQLEAVHQELERETRHAKRWRAVWVLPVKEA